MSLSHFTGEETDTDDTTEIQVLSLPASYKSALLPLDRL